MSREGSIRVLIADDHPVVRLGLRSALEGESVITVVGVAGSFHELMRLLGQVGADVVLFDLGGMGAPPISAISALARTYPKTAIIVFSSHLGGVHELLKLGARGYIAKEDWEDNVARAIYSVMQEKVFLSPAVIDHLERSKGAQKELKLTPREWDILKFIADGLGTQEIMSQLSIAEQTVSNYVHTLYRKTGCVERTQLADWYRQFGYGNRDPSN